MFASSRAEHVRRLHEQGRSGRATAAQLGIAAPTVSYHLRKLGVPAQQQRRYDWAAVQRYNDDGHGLLEPRCAECGIDAWRGRPIGLQLHHINGEGQDNRLENTWGGRNRRVAAA